MIVWTVWLKRWKGCYHALELSRSAWNFQMPEFFLGTFRCNIVLPSDCCWDEKRPGLDIFSLLFDDFPNPNKLHCSLYKAKCGIGKKVWRLSQGNIFMYLLNIVGDVFWLSIPFPSVGILQFVTNNYSQFYTSLVEAYCSYFLFLSSDIFQMRFLFVFILSWFNSF